jgi:hypothetical protein
VRRNLCVHGDFVAAAETAKRVVLKEGFAIPKRFRPRAPTRSLNNGHRSQSLPVPATNLNEAEMKELKQFFVLLLLAGLSVSVTVDLPHNEQVKVVLKTKMGE